MVNPSATLVVALRMEAFVREAEDITIAESDNEKGITDGEAVELERTQCCIYSMYRVRELVVCHWRNEKSKSFE